MFTKSVEVEIARPIDEVFAFVSDARNRPRWDEGVESEELTSPEPIGVGSTVRTTMRSRGGKRQIDWRITEHDPPSHQRIESTSGPFPTTLIYRLEPRGEATAVSFSVTGDPSGVMKLLQPLVGRMVQANLDSGFPRLKRLMETGSAE
jgi:carbon monoxide dehydrogenase subunit G